MKSVRRRFLAAGAAGMTTLWVPNISMACGHRRRATVLRCDHPMAATPSAPTMVSPTHSINTDEFYTCPAYLIWSPTLPFIPNASNIKPGVMYQITVFGTGLAQFNNNGGAFQPNVQDNAPNTQVAWTISSLGASVAPNAYNGYDSLSFYASESGSMSSSGSITITVTLYNYSPKCGHTWNNVGITYG